MAGTLGALALTLTAPTAEAGHGFGGFGGGGHGFHGGGGGGFAFHGGGGGGLKFNGGGMGSGGHAFKHSGGIALNPGRHIDHVVPRYRGHYNGQMAWKNWDSKHHHPRRFVRYYYAPYYYPYYAYYDYSSYGSCGYYYRRWQITGDPYWWDRYQSCID